MHEAALACETRTRGVNRRSADPSAVMMSRPKKEYVMPTWKQSLMDWVDYDGYDAGESEPCEVRIDENAIVVSYEDDRGAVNYIGEGKGPGHFALESPERNGKATLRICSRVARSSKDFGLRRAGRGSGG